MFRRLRVKNHQAHQDTIFEFSPGITAILGDMDCGKTAGLMRSLELLSDNRPSTPNYFSDFAGDEGWTEVRLDVVDEDSTEHSVEIRKHIKVEIKKGQRIKRAISEDSEYIIDQGEPLKGFGMSVPEEVTKLINLSEAAIQDQDDPAFFISFKPGEATRVINRIARLENIDDWLLKFSKKQNQTSAAIKVVKRDIESIETKLKGLVGVTLLKQDMDRLEVIEYEIDNVQTEIKDIANLIASRERAEKWLHAEEDLKGTKDMYAGVLSLNERINEAQEEMDLLKKFLTWRNRLKALTAKQIETANEYVSLMRETGLCPLCFGAIGAETGKRIAREILKG